MRPCLLCTRRRWASNVGDPQTLAKVQSVQRYRENLDPAAVLRGAALRMKLKEDGKKYIYMKSVLTEQHVQQCRQQSGRRVKEEWRRRLSLPSYHMVLLSGSEIVA